MFKLYQTAHFKSENKNDVLHKVFYLEFFTQNKYKRKFVVKKLKHKPIKSRQNGFR